MTIAVPRRLFDLLSVWGSVFGTSGVVVFVGGVGGVGVMTSGDGSRGVISGIVTLSGFGAGSILAGVSGTMFTLVVL